MDTTYYVTKDFWIKAGERALRTFGQSSVAAIGVATASQNIPGFGGVDWIMVLSFTGLTTLLSVLNSIAGPASIMSTDTSVAPVTPLDAKVPVSAVVVEDAVQAAITALFANALQAVPAPVAKPVPAELKTVIAPVEAPAEPVTPITESAPVEAPVVETPAPVEQPAVAEPVVEPVAEPVKVEAPVEAPVAEVPAAPVDVPVTLTKDELIAQLTARLAALEAVPTPGASVEAPLGYITGKAPEAN